MPTLLGPAVERHLRSIVDDAIKVQGRGKHATMTVDDINTALALSKNEVVYGFSFCRPLRITNFSGESDVHYLPEEEIDLMEAVQAPLPPAPIACSFVGHWLAVDGTQPAVPQNPVGAFESSDGILSVEDGPAATNHGASNALVHDASAVVCQSEATETQHVLSQEMQLYFTKVVAAIKSCHDSQQRPVFRALSQDRGLQELMPYFSRLIQKVVANNLRNLPLLKAMMMTVRCFLANPYVHIELYLHQIISAVLTCIVGKRLSASPAEDHWSLRDMSADIVATIIKKYVCVASF